MIWRRAEPFRLLWPPLSECCTARGALAGTAMSTAKRKRHVVSKPTSPAAEDIAAGSTHLGDGAALAYWPRAIPYSQELCQQLINDVPWMHKQVRVVGRLVYQPRLVAYMADHADLSYTYSGLKLEVMPFFDTVAHVKQQVEHLTGCTFNSCLLNYYRDGRDHVSWHSDNEAVYGPTPSIASVSLGHARTFVLRCNQDRTRKLEAELGCGDVLLMHGTTQQHWMHALPKRAAVHVPRVSLTFRQVLQPVPS